MTYNQILYTQAAEEKRHNQKYEAETARHNVEQERIDQERNRIEDWYNQERVRLEDRMTSLKEAQLYLQKVEDYVAWSGQYPEWAQLVQAESDANTLFGDWIHRQPTISYTNNWLSYAYAEASGQLKEAEDRYNTESSNLNYAQTRLTIAAQQTYSNIYKDLSELKLKHDEQKKKFDVYNSEISLNSVRAEHERAAKNLAESQATYQQYLNSKAGLTFWTNYSLNIYNSVLHGYSDAAKGTGDLLRGVASLYGVPSINNNYYDGRQEFDNLFKDEKQPNAFDRAWNALHNKK